MILIVWRLLTSNVCFVVGHGDDIMSYAEKADDPCSGGGERDMKESPSLSDEGVNGRIRSPTTQLPRSI